MTFAIQLEKPSSGAVISRFTFTHYGEALSAFVRKAHESRIYAEAHNESQRLVFLILSPEAKSDAEPLTKPGI